MDTFVLLTISAAGQQFHEHPNGHGVSVGDVVCVIREADNRVDESAVRLYMDKLTNNRRTVLGYVAQGPNRVVSRLLDAGYHITGTVVQTDASSTTVELKMRTETR